MKPDPETWILHDDEETKAVAELTGMTHRAGAIVAAVILENRIEKMLKRHLLDEESKGSTLHADMFRGSGPLGALSTKINLAFMLGLYSAGAWKDLHYIREIRNHFAHELAAKGFDSHKVASLTMNIKWFERFIVEKGAPISQMMHDPNLRLYEHNVQAQLEKPRERYLLAVKFYVAAFHAPSTAQRQGGLCTPQV